MLKFNEDAIKKDVEETLALRKDVEVWRKVCYGDHIGYRKYSGNDRCCALWQGKRSYDFWICG